MWEELLYGNGFWLGLLLQLALLYIVSYVVPRFGFVGAIYCLLMVMVYNDNLLVTSFNMWGMIFLGLNALPLTFIGLKNK